MMQSIELGNKILVNLYERYYQGGYRNFYTTVDIVEELGIPQELRDVALKRCAFLTDDGQIHGNKVLGLLYPKSIRIEPYGIYKVESLNQEYSTRHSDIRLKILAKLYEWYFEKHDERTVLVDSELVKDLGFDQSEASLVFGDITYLTDKGLIKGYWNFGHYPYRIEINANGINLFESLVSKMAESPRLKQSAEVAKQPDALSTWKAIRKFLVANPELIKVTIEIVKELLT